MTFRHKFASQLHNKSHKHKHKPSATNLSTHFRLQKFRTRLPFLYNVFFHCIPNMVPCVTHFFGVPLTCHARISRLSSATDLPCWRILVEWAKLETIDFSVLHEVGGKEKVASQLKRVLQKPGEWVLCSALWPIKCQQEAENNKSNWEKSNLFRQTRHHTILSHHSFHWLFSRHILHLQFQHFTLRYRRPILARKSLLRPTLRREDPIPC
jgi:hypothetical protein